MAITLTVRYPTKGRAMFVRTDDDWERDLAPISSKAEGDVLEFHLERDDPFFEFKVVLREPSGELSWSLHSNYVASAALSSSHDVYPNFHSGAGRITEPIEIAAPGDAVPHRIRVYLPPGYDENTYKRYPVVYMHDGTNLFFPEESFQGEAWDVQGTLDALDTMNAIEPVAVVGIAPVDRMTEYTAEGAAAYARYLIDHVKPRADARGRTLPGPEHTAVMGSSLGGLVSLYLAWNHSDVFGAAGCLSSTFAFDDFLFRQISSERKKPIRVYLDSGFPRDNFEATLAMRDTLLRKGYVWGRDLLHFAHPGARHDEAAWAVRLHLPFQFFFGRGPAYT